MMQSNAQKQRIEVIRGAKNDKAILKYLCTQLGKTTHPDRWLNELLDSGLLESATIPPGRKNIEKGNEIDESDYWYPMLYIQNLTLFNEKKPNETISKYLNTFLVSVIEQQKKFETDGLPRNIPIDYLLSDCLPKLPIEMIEEMIPDLSDILRNYSQGNANNLFKVLIPKALESEKQELIKNIIRLMLETNRIDRKNYFGEGMIAEFRSIFGNYWLVELSQEYGKLLFEKYAKFVFEISLEKVRNLAKDAPDYFSWLKVDAIEGGYESHAFHNIEYEFVLLRWLRESLRNLNSQLGNILPDLIKDPLRIIQRVALDSIKENYEAFGNIFWEHFKDENPIDVIDIKHEVFELLRANADKLSSEQLNQLIDWIEDPGSSKKYYDELRSERGDAKAKSIEAYNKLEWYQFALVEKVSDERIKKKVEELRLLAPWERSIPAGRWRGRPEMLIGNVSPYKYESLLEISPEELVNLIQEFDSKKDVESSGDKPSKEGLSDVLQRIAATHPDKITLEFDRFRSLEFRYLRNIFYGFRDAWSSSRALEWKKILDLADRKCEKKEFWQRVNAADKTKFTYEEHFVNAVADLIYEGTNNWKKAIPDDLGFDPTQKILLCMLRNYQFNWEIQNSDTIGKFFNVTGGRIWEATIHSWFYIEQLKKDSMEKYKDHENQLKVWTTEYLKSSKISNECRVGLARGFGGLWYYDTEWCHKHFEKIFPIDESIIAVMVFSNYLVNVAQIHKELYDLMEAKGLYRLAIENENLDQMVRDSLAGHMMVGYFDFESQMDNSESLISIFLSRTDEFLLARFSWCCWRQEENLSENQRKLILPLWNKILNRMELLRKEGKKIDDVVFYLCEWPILVPELTDLVVEAVKDTLKYIEDQFSLNKLLESVSKFWEKNPDKVVSLFEYALTKEKYFPLSKENINSIEKMSEHENNYSEKIKGICNRYASEGDESLKEIGKREE